MKYSLKQVNKTGLSADNDKRKQSTSYIEMNAKKTRKDIICRKEEIKYLNIIIYENSQL